MEELIARQIKDKETQEVSGSNLSLVIHCDACISLFMQVTELVLDNGRCSEVTGLLENFTNLKRLSIVNAGLTSLKGFPPLPNLKEVAGVNRMNFLKIIVLNTSFK